jgi:6-phosphogluconolactonase
MTDSTTRNQPNSNSTRIEILKDLDAISRHAADEILRRIDRLESSADRYTVALSGGSTPGRLYRRLGREPTVRDRLPWDKIHFFWGDERHVPPDHPQSNYRMANEALFASAPVPKKNIHRVNAEEPDAMRAAADYERELSSFFELRPGQLPRFDCILLGIGPDGHTASLFPGTKALHAKERLAVANWVEKLKTYRITLTAPVVNQAALIIFLVSGKEKAEILKEILEGAYRPDLLPAQLIRPENGNLLWLVDEAAGAGLDDKTRFQI